MKNLYLIFVSQEYQTANHKSLWQLLSSRRKDDCFVIINIPADKIISRIKRRNQRIKESKEPPKKITDNLYLFRPLFFIRPEVAPAVSYKSIGKSFLKQIEVFEINQFDNVFCLIYNAVWIKILKSIDTQFKFGYYLFDEVRLNAHNCKPNKKRTKLDIYACNNSDIIFAISKGVAENRKSYLEKMVVIGNGSFFDSCTANRTKQNNKSVAFIGNFRSWIDKKLFRDIIELKKDYEFHIIGPVEKNMQNYLKMLLNDYKNVSYDGIKTKETIKEEYSKYVCVLIPYIQNAFIYCTRPIKIVESVFEKTPVVTIPVSGFNENEYIRFAKTPEEFSLAIEDLYNNPPNFNSRFFGEFIDRNSWNSIAIRIIDQFELLVSNGRGNE